MFVYWKLAGHIFLSSQNIKFDPANARPSVSRFLSRLVTGFRHIRAASRGSINLKVDIFHKFVFSTTKIENFNSIFLIAFMLNWEEKCQNNIEKNLKRSFVRIIFSTVKTIQEKIEKLQVNNRSIKRKIYDICYCTHNNSFITLLPVREKYFLINLIA